MKLEVELNFEIENKNIIEDCSDQLQAAFENYIEQILPEYQGPELITCELSLVDDAAIRELNKQYRNKDKATDVLSFPVHENLRYDDIEDTGILHLGDIVISVDTMLNQAKAQGITVTQEFIHLFFHGILHLCGYDHELNADEESLMQSLEDQLVAHVYQAKGWSK